MRELSLADGPGGPSGDVGLRALTGGALRALARCVVGMRAVVVARLDLEGRLLDANRGFAELVDARAARAGVAGFLVRPEAGSLLALARGAADGATVFAGVLDLAGERSTVRPLRATVLRDGASVLIVGERDLGGLERLAGTLLALNGALTDRGRELERLNRSLLEREAELARLAATDQLTELPNRRTLLARLRGELAAAAGRGRPVCVALADLDRFKLINDAHGHEAGDAALVLVARTLRESLRAGDLVGRWGGEEFLVVLGGTALEEALAVVERLRARVRERSAEAAATGPITASFGVAQAEPGEDAALLVRRADRALYAAKAAGRDAVRSCDGRQAPAALAAAAA